MHFDVDEIAEVALLSASGWEDVLASVPNVLIESSHPWWTCSPCRAHDCAVFVNTDGSIFHSGAYVMANNIGIRPVFKVRPRTTNILLPGTKVTVGAFDGIVINDIQHTNQEYYHVLCNAVVTMHSFDDKTNDFSYSDIKYYINSPNFLRGIASMLFLDHSNGWIK